MPFEAAIYFILGWSSAIGLLLGFLLSVFIPRMAEASKLLSEDDKKLVGHHPRTPLVLEGGTIFHFVTKRQRVALEMAREAANGKDVRVGGGAATIRQYLQERLIDELHVAISPVLLGAGVPLFDGINLPDLGYACTRQVASQRATHIVLTRI